MTDKSERIPLLNIPFFMSRAEILPALNIYGEEILVIEYDHTKRKLFRESRVPMEIENFSVIMVSNGECTIHVDYIPYRLSENMFIVLRPKLLISELLFSEDFLGYQIVARHDFMRMAMGNNVFPTKELFDRRVVLPVVKAKAEDFRRLEEFTRQLSRNIRLDGHMYQRSLIQNSLCNINLELWNITAKLSQEELQQGKSPTLKEKLAFQFVHMVLARCKEKRDVSDYAKELSISPVYLTRILKKVTGKTGSGWINEVLTNEAKLLLHRPGKPIQEIAVELNFSEQAAFSKFFRKNTGMSPLEYRNGYAIK